MPLISLLGVALGIAAVVLPPPKLPPSGAVARGERQVQRAQRDHGGLTSPAALGLSVQADGGLLYVDPGLRFKARIATDGSVTFADRWRRPTKRKRGRKRERGRCCGAPPGGTAPAANVLLGAPVSGPTEWALAVRGHDPNAAAKAAFLARTATLRTALAKSAMRQDMRHALDTLEHNLQLLWEDGELPEARKRSLVFARWDALASPAAVARSASDLDRLRASYGDRARRRIEAFVRRRLPTGSGREFTVTELSRLNAGRRSQRQFIPYRTKETTDG
ncbi:MAG: hypothetical protein JKY37_19470 [Nannocystaceae bacterium]|nr:hypothetical protein [Nannocystaceae bacterium]